MIDKKYFFLAGLPRSGNTLLSSILNQNPEINVSANSFVCDILFHGISLQYHECFQNFPDKKSLEDFISSTFDSYYQNWNGTYIIDRGPWGTPQNLNILKEYLNNEIKIIVPVRNITEIIASFIRKNPSFIQRDYNEEVNYGIRFSETYKSEIEIKCEIITKSNSQLEKFLFSLYNLTKPENKNFLHIVEYDDLIFNTEKTIENVYNFLEIKKYKHNFNQIENFRINNVKYQDEHLFGCDLHSVRNKISKPSYKITDVLPDDIIKKYSNREFWR